MYGTVIGDLAASIYLSDRYYFYKHLVSDKEELSCYGRAFLDFAEVYTQEGIVSIRQFDEIIVRYRPLTTIDYGIEAMYAIATGWYGVSLEDCNNMSFLLFSSYCSDIQSVLRSLTQIILLLRQGCTKQEVSARIVEVLNSCVEIHQPTTLLSYIMQSWQSFTSAFDYGSALHRAMKHEGCKHFMGALIGAIADAMYGCANYIIKRKYNSDKESPYDVMQPISLPHSLQNIIYSSRIEVIPYQFYVKNEARTNIEKHVWTSLIQYQSLYSQMLVTNEQYYRILQSSPTSWECRYGLYLDDGWLYIYRSFHIIGRF